MDDKDNLMAAFYQELSPKEIERRITTVRSRLGDSLLILGHHYMTDGVIAYADQRGDSFALARMAARTDAEYIVFCGVHFMAETADIVTDLHQKIFIPDPSAGCFLADCARMTDVEKAWHQLQERSEEKIIPITYVNSGADMKAFCGKNGGLVCTSSNAQAALQWAFERGRKVFFFPDQHLGRNTAYAMGIPLEEMLLWNPEKELGGNSEAAVQQARAILWQGYCDVHQEFTPSDVRELRAADPDIQILVHPECSFEVAQMADSMGSTAHIIRVIEEAAAGSHWAIATEKNLVNRLKIAHPDKRIQVLQLSEPYCRTMAQITTAKLAYQLEQLEKGNRINQVVVSQELREPARLALDRMLELVL